MSPSVPPALDVRMTGGGACADPLHAPATAGPIALHWAAPSSVPALARREVHVWSASLEHDAQCVAGMETSLAPDERERSARYRFERDRARFSARRATVRRILAAYAGGPPAALKFHLGPHGKPALAGIPGAGLRFNVSDSAGLALVAVTRHRDLGVDLERIRPDVEADVARRFFSAVEVAALDALPAEQRLSAFFACWTRKEAYVKAKGEGLSLALHRFAVSVAPGEPARLIHAADDPEEIRRWRLEGLDPAAGYAAALAVEGGDWRLRCWRWPSGCACEAGS